MNADLLRAVKAVRQQSEYLKAYQTPTVLSMARAMLQREANPLDTPPVHFSNGIAEWVQDGFLIRAELVSDECNDFDDMLGARFISSPSDAKSYEYVMHRDPRNIDRHSYEWVACSNVTPSDKDAHHYAAMARENLEKYVRGSVYFVGVKVTAHHRKTRTELGNASTWSVEIDNSTDKSRAESFEYVADLARDTAREAIAEAKDALNILRAG